MALNILQFVQGFHQGGSERQAVQLTRLLHQAGADLPYGRCRVRMASMDPTGPLRAEVERLGLGEIPSFPLTSFYNRDAMRQLRRLVTLLRAWRIDVVQTHDFYSNIFGMAGAALAGVPVRIAARRESAVRPSLQRRVERFAYRLSHAVVANCEELRRQLIAEGVPAAKTAVIYNGIDLARLDPGVGLGRAALLERVGLFPYAKRRLVTIVANLLPVKDHATFLRAARGVRAEMPDAAFILAGSGDEASRLQALATHLGIESDVRFLGRCGEVAALLAVSDVCVLSSRSEGFPNAILEYMAASRPVVATDVGGAAEAVIEGETGHLVSAGDHLGMADRIVSLLRDPDRARAMGESGRQRVSERFSCAVQLARTYQLIAGKNLATESTEMGHTQCECS